MSRLQRFFTNCKQTAKPHVKPRIWAAAGSFYRLSMALPDLLQEVAIGGLPEKIIGFGGAIGDDLLCTIIGREFRRRGIDRIWMLSYHGQIFQGNPDFCHVTSHGSWTDALRELVPRHMPILNYLDYDSVSDTAAPPSEHICAIMCRKAGILGAIEARPWISLSHSELKKQEWAKGYIAIQSSGLDAVIPMLNKQWPSDRFNTVSRQLVRKAPVVQLGGHADPLLDASVDLRGRTSIRETAAILANCRMYVGTVGMLMHLARSVECPAVIIYGGRERPEQSGYSCNVNITSSVSCSPCWRQNECSFERVCMSAISVEMVLEGAERCLERYAECNRPPLSVDTWNIA